MDLPAHHTAITWMLQAEVPIWEVAVFAAMTVKLVEGTYGHATVTSKRRAARALARIPQQTPAAS